ncbi:hypothetical protein [Sorangium sp. So ce1335]|uniref:hypothetical protein n=1 Tax=Sorangium sp. So ce1335 TaxID=3133335 RepID=UPI003F5D6D35
MARASRREPAAAGARLWRCGALVCACCAGGAGCAEGARPAPAATAVQGASAATAVQGAPAEQGAPAATAASSAPAGAPPSPPGEQERSGDAVPRERWVGALELTKGAQPMIAGRIMAREDAERWLGPDWRALRGQRVRVVAVLRDHVCEPHAQCLSGGRIPLLEQVASVELCAAAGPGGRPDGADCAPSPAQVARCEADCRSLGAGCGRDGDRGALRRCGCAKVACYQGCRETGEPSFACR